jgi:hypothetical protein
MVGIDFDLKEFNEHITYFKDRYIDENRTNERFNHLRINNQQYSNLVTNVLLEQDTRESSIIMALFVIVYRYRYRYRNNLFHGNKNILNLDTQEVNFYHANLILTKVLNRF